jgi:hypothetical protein
MKHAWDEDAQDAAAGTPEVRGGSFSRGLLIAVPISALLWALLAWLL